MSCFKGRMLEYRNISLDRFDGLNLKSTVYFLSHCHEDHTVGLSSPQFFERISSRNDLFVYCSKVTMLLLMANPKYQHLDKYIKSLPVDEPVSVPIPHQDSDKMDIVSVTLIHAGHCPGSVMFLMEGSEGTVLYTGDFRWESDRVAGISALHVGDSVKPIRSLYIDTTFCHPDSFYIPPRHESIGAVCTMAREWLSQGPNHVIHFRPRSNYGHEPLLKEVARLTGCLIHTERRKANLYEQIPDLCGVFTSDAMATPIHACSGFACRDALPCNYTTEDGSKMKLMVILPSTMYFTQQLRLNQENIVVKDKGIYRVCYSFHSSLAEVRDLVTYLHPDRVRPNVKPVDDDSIGIVQKRLNGFLELKNIEREKKEEETPLGILRQTKRKRTHFKYSLSSDSEGLIFSSGEEKSKKRKIFSPVKSGEAVNDVENFISVACSNDRNDDDEDHSSYNGSNQSDSELSGICDEDFEKEKEESKSTLSTPGQSLLDAINSQCEDNQSESLSYRVCRFDDVEQTLEEAIPTDELPEGDEDNERGQDEVKSTEKGHGDMCNNKELCDKNVFSDTGKTESETKHVPQDEVGENRKPKDDEVHDKGHGKVKRITKDHNNSTVKSNKPENEVEVCGSLKPLQIEDSVPRKRNSLSLRKINTGTSHNNNNSFTASARSVKVKGEVKVNSMSQRTGSFDLFDENSNQSDFEFSDDHEITSVSKIGCMNNGKNGDSVNKIWENGDSQGFDVNPSSCERDVVSQFPVSSKHHLEDEQSSGNSSCPTESSIKGIFVRKDNFTEEDEACVKISKDVSILFDCEDSEEEEDEDIPNIDVLHPKGSESVRESKDLANAYKSNSDINIHRNTCEINTSFVKKSVTYSPVSLHDCSFKSDGYGSDSDITLPPSQGSFQGNMVLLSPQKNRNRNSQRGTELRLSSESENLIVISDETDNEQTLDSSSGSKVSVEGVSMESFNTIQRGQKSDGGCSQGNSTASPKKLVQRKLTEICSPVKRNGSAIQVATSTSTKNDIKQQRLGGDGKLLNSGHKHMIIIDCKDENEADDVIDLTNSDDTISL